MAAILSVPQCVKLTLKDIGTSVGTQPKQNTAEGEP